MMRAFRYLGSTSAVLLTGFGGVKASADTTTPATYSIPAQVLVPSSSTTQTLNFPISTSFAKFDGSLGTLMGVTFQYQYDAQLILVNESTEDSGGGGSLSGAFSVDGFDDGGGGQGTGGAVPAGSKTIIPFSFGGTVTSSQSTVEAKLLDSVTGVPGSTSAFELGAFAGVAPSSSVSVENDLLGTSQLTVTYTYTPQPEPSAIALVGGAGFLGLSSRRSRR